MYRIEQFASITGFVGFDMDQTHWRPPESGEKNVNR